MKKTYFFPECEEVNVELESNLLTVSGGGIADDGSATKSDDDTDPGDFGW